MDITDKKVLRNQNMWLMLIKLADDIEQLNLILFRHEKTESISWALRHIREFQRTNSIKSRIFGQRNCAAEEQNEKICICLKISKLSSKWPTNQRKIHNVNSIIYCCRLLGPYNKLPQTGGLNRHSFLAVQEAERWKIRVLAGWGSWGPSSQPADDLLWT